MERGYIDFNVANTISIALMAGLAYAAFSGFGMLYHKVVPATAVKAAVSASSAAKAT